MSTAPEGESATPSMISKAELTSGLPDGIQHLFGEDPSPDYLTRDQKRERYQVLRASRQYSRLSPPSELTEEISRESTDVTRVARQRLAWLMITSQQHYHVHRIPKRKPGKFRTIYNPSVPMRRAQFRIKQIIDRVPVPDYLFAFEAGRRIGDMAQIHAGKQMVISLDIKDFFPSIKQFDVEEIFSQIGFNETDARMLSEVCTYKSFLPQGGLTSPKLSSLFTSISFGPKVKALCDERGWAVTIYADDITLSTDAVSENGGADALEMISEIKKVLKSYGLRLSPEKTKRMPRKVRQYVCGLVVNERANLLRRKRLQIRALLHNMDADLQAAAIRAQCTSLEELMAKVRGQLSWWKSVCPESTAPYIEKYQRIWYKYKEGIDNALLPDLARKAASSPQDC